MSNAQTALTNRQYYAIHGNWGPAPGDFIVDPPVGKPGMPATINQLNDQEQAALRRIIDALENAKPIVSGGGLPGPTSGVANLSELQSDLAKSAYTEILAYYARPDVKRWMLKKRVQREALWKVFNGDVHDEAEQAGIVISSNTLNGAGSNSTGASTPPGV